MSVEKTPLFLFPAESDSRHQVAQEFIREWFAAEDLGLACALLDFDRLIDGKDAEIRGAPLTDRVVIYRGWLCQPSEYKRLESSVRQRGGELLTSTAAYVAAACLTHWYPRVATQAIPSVWDSDPGSAWHRAHRRFGPPPYVIRDDMKSAKALWPRGCVVPEGSMEQAFLATCAELRAYRGERFSGHYVVRPQIALRHLEENPLGRHPFFEEYRLVFVFGELVAACDYSYAQGDGIDAPAWRGLGRVIPSPFFTADVAVDAEGVARLLEFGDGGTSALPPALSAAELFSRLIKPLANE